MPNIQAHLRIGKNSSWETQKVSVVGKDGNNGSQMNIDVEAGDSKGLYAE